MNAKEDVLSNKSKHLDVLCFPTLFPSRKFGESHDNSIPISVSEFAKSRLLNKDSQSPKKENEAESYYYSLLLLFVSFRNECELTEEGECRKCIQSAHRTK